MKTIIPSNASDDMFDALLEICSIHIGLISQNFNFRPTFFTPFKIPRSMSLNMWPPSKGTIELDL